MTDLSITPANVAAGPDSVMERGILGETVTAGMPVYQDTTTKKYMKADSNSAAAAARRPRGIALNGGGLNQPVEVQRSGDISIGAALTAGATYFVSDTPGGICPDADVGSGEYVCLLGVAKSTTVLTLNIQFPNVAR
jgi:hypothetical protein